MRYSKDWQDYKIIDTSNGEKLERFGKYTLIRPDPQVIWDTPRENSAWKNANGHYTRSSTGGGQWDCNRLPEVWSIGYKSLKFNLKPMGFKHTGIFPEQAVNWDWMSEKIQKSERKISVLNLFAYTGGATVACASAGAEVVHVDASKGMVAWAKENLAISGLSEMPVRFIVDDCIKFVQREIRRGKKYDAIIMDPPSYGRGPSGEIWKIEEQIFELLKICVEVLSDSPLFFMLNSYTTGLSPSVMGYLLGVTVGEKFKGQISADEIGLMVEQTGFVLPCGTTAIWETI
jgi:23S rRNA (cytosine1962-C5)-methyltransferase